LSNLLNAIEHDAIHRPSNGSSLFTLIVSAVCSFRAACTSPAAPLLSLANKNIFQLVTMEMEAITGDWQRRQTGGAGGAGHHHQVVSGTSSHTTMLNTTASTTPMLSTTSSTTGAQHHLEHHHS
jgi:hypothetical protein